MSFVTARPDMLTSAAEQLAGAGSAMATENAAGAGPTEGVVPPAADAVSTLLARKFAATAASYQAISAQAATFHDQFVATMSTSAACYAETESANAAAAG